MTCVAVSTLPREGMLHARMCSWTHMRGIAMSVEITHAAFGAAVLAILAIVGKILATDR